MKKLVLFLIIIVLLNTNIIQAENVLLLPEPETLYNRFPNTPFIDFFERTDLIEKLGGKKMSIGEFFFYLWETALECYKSCFPKDSYAPKCIEVYDLKIIKIILQDSPKAFKQFKQTLLIQRSS